MARTEPDHRATARRTRPTYNTASITPGREPGGARVRDECAGAGGSAGGRADGVRAMDLTWKSAASQPCRLPGPRTAASRASARPAPAPTQPVALALRFRCRAAGGSAPGRCSSMTAWTRAGSLQVEDARAGAPHRSSITSRPAGGCRPRASWSAASSPIRLCSAAAAPGPAGRRACTADPRGETSPSPAPAAPCKPRIGPGRDHINWTAGLITNWAAIALELTAGMSAADALELAKRFEPILYFHAAENSFHRTPSATLRCAHCGGHNRNSM